MMPRIIFCGLALLSLVGLSCVDPDIIRAHDAGMTALRIEAANHDIIVDMDTAEKKRLSNGWLLEQAKALVIAESQPTTRRTLDILDAYDRRRTKDEKGFDAVAEKQKELNAARVALELLQPGNTALHRIEQTQNELRQLVKGSSNEND